MQSKNNNLSLSILITVFFFWGFVAASNNILIPLFKDKLHLNQTQAQYIDFAFYAAYFIGTILYFIVGQLVGQDPLNKYGYKNGIIFGLLFSAFGALFFYPAAQAQSFELTLLALFLVGLGFSLQQTAAQPFAIALGDESTGAQRLNLAGGINNLGTTVGPVLVSFAIFGQINDESIKTAAANASITSVQLPYLVLAATFVFVAIFFYFSKLPNIKNEEVIEPGFGALKYPQLVLGMIAIFVYVGVEVAIASNLGELLKQKMNLDAASNSHWVSLFWGSMMIGRWTGAISAFNLKPTANLIATLIIPFVAFGIYLLINILRGSSVNEIYPFVIPIAFMVLFYLQSKGNPSKMLMVYSLFGIIGMLIGLMTSGYVSLFAFVSGGLACSVMWPCIFNLSVAGLGKYTSQGSAFLIMMILGGAIIPVLQGSAADYIGIQESYSIPLLCFVYLLWFAYAVNNILKKQGINFSETNVNH